ncbi:MAG: sigma-E factor negative regulatory protein [Burkholderiales bacterium]|nr:sigma-E factor negative regulatory protein [Burkholderiales bacterium]
MKERVSALMDDQLDGSACDGCLDELGKDADLRRDWALYHLIGDTLRGTAAHTLPTAFGARLAAEPTVLAPRPARRRAAPRGTWHYAFAAAAGVAAVAFVGAFMLPQLQPGGGVPVANAPQKAPLPVASAPATPAPVVPVAHGMDDYLLAHQRYSPSSAMSGVAPYVRTVSEPAGSR